MEKVLIDIWPILMTALVAAVGWQFRESHTLKTKVAVMEKTIEDIQGDIDKIQKRQDSHSKKQDEILTLITEFKLEVIKQISELSADLKALNSTLEVWDGGAKLTKKKGK